jgi:hypothetical protein
MDDYTKVYMTQIREFYKRVIEPKCSEAGLEHSLKNFLNIEKSEDSIVNNSYVFLIDAPKMLLVSSRSFVKYYNDLDRDFKEDIMLPGEMKDLKIELINKFTVALLANYSFSSF